MLEKYSDINLYAKKYLINELSKKCSDEKKLDRCNKELDMLYKKGLLFIVKYLYDFKKDHEVSYHFHGTINNLFILYVLGISRVDAIKYNLPYELFDDKQVNVDLIDYHPFELVWYIESVHDCKIVYCYHDKEDNKKIDELLDEQYMLIPSSKQDDDMLFRINEYGMFETSEDYRKYNDKYITIRIGELSSKMLNISTEFEQDIYKILNPKTFDDYVKINSLSKGSNVWKNNQDALGKSNINNIIANKEDIYEYLIKHEIEKNIIINIIKYINKSPDKKKDDLSAWNEYVSIMKNHNCDDEFINIIEKQAYISGRGEAISLQLLK